MAEKTLEERVKALEKAINFHHVVVVGIGAAIFGYFVSDHATLSTHDNEIKNHVKAIGDAERRAEDSEKRAETNLKKVEDRLHNWELRGFRMAQDYVQDAEFISLKDDVITLRAKEGLRSFKGNPKQVAFAGTLKVNQPVLFMESASDPKQLAVFAESDPKP